MRYLILGALAVLTVGLFDARPANAAWQCMGGELACGGPSAAPKKVWQKQGRAASHRAVRQKKVAVHRSAKAGSAKVARAKEPSARQRAATRSVAASSGSYGGGSVGIASYYWQGTQTASGARFNPGAMTAAHRTLPFGTKVLVTHMATGRAVTVTINDRGPFIKGRIIDLSRGAAGALGITGAGLARVQVSVLGRG